VWFSVSIFSLLRRFWSPTWLQLEPMLEPCWALFGTFLGVPLASQLKIAFKTIFCRFLTSWGMKNVQKPLVFVGRNEDACFCAMIALETDLGPILVRFWTPKSFQNRSQESPEWCWKSCSFLHAFGNLQKIIFLANLGPTWPPRWPQVGAQMGPKSVQKMVSKAMSEK